MAHHTRTWTDEELAPGFAPTGADFAAIDGKTESLINGDEGGEWGPPSSDLEIGGAGVVIAAASTWTGGEGDVPVSGITFGKGTEDDCFGVTSPMTSATMRQAMRSGAPAIPGFVSAQSVLDFKGVIFRRRSPSIAGVTFLSPLDVYNGGRLTSATVYAAAGEDHASAPTSMPKVRIVRMADDGTFESLRSESAEGTDERGFTPFASAAWTALATQDLSYACDQNNETDTSKYAYLIECMDEFGTNAWTTTGTIFGPIEMSFDSIAYFNGRH